MALRVYIASRARPDLSMMWRRVRAEGKIEVTSRWIDELSDRSTIDFRRLWRHIGEDISRSQALIVYLESRDLPARGALVEIGMALATSLPVIVVAPDVVFESDTDWPLGSWIHHPLVRVMPSLTLALDWCQIAESTLQAESPP